MRNLFSVLKQSITLSLQNIKSNKMRTFLTTLGIIIGVTAVIALITIVNGVIGYMMGEFSSLGAVTLNISIQGTPLKKGLTDTDLERLKALDNVAGITPEISTTLTGAKRGGEMVKKVSVSGYSEAYFQKNENLVTVGRPLTKVDMDNESYVCIIDNDLAKALFAGENPIGQTVILGNISYTVVGLEGKNDDLMDSMSRMGNSIDGSAIIPYTTAKKVTGTDALPAGRNHRYYFGTADFICGSAFAKYNFCLFAVSGSTRNWLFYIGRLNLRLDARQKSKPAKSHRRPEK